MARDYQYDILEEIKKRYATRVFGSEAVTREELMPVFEAARYAPSAYNEQPWRFIVGYAGDENHRKIAGALMDGNAAWAGKAPVLILALCTKNFKLNNEPNAHSRYDTGTATAFLQLEAARQGLVTHCMSGFFPDQAREVFEIPDGLDIVVTIALGKPGDPALTDKEKAGERNALERLFLFDKTDS